MNTEIENWLKFIRSSNVLFSDINKTTWDNARGYVFDEEKLTLYFPVPNKDLKNKEQDKFQVKILGSGFRNTIIRGILTDAINDDDIKKVFNLLIKQKQAGWNEQKARYSLFDSRNGKPRKNRFKLKITKVLFSDPDFYGGKEQHEVKLT